MVDFMTLKDRTTLGITDEGVGLSYNGMDDEYDEDQDIGFVDIIHHGGSVTTPYPTPTAHHRIVDGSTELTGWFVEAKEVKTDDGIIYYDHITLRNGVYLTIDDAQITVFDLDDKLIDLIERP